jgi:hypothetical protein
LQAHEAGGGEADLGGEENLGGGESPDDSKTAEYEDGEYGLNENELAYASEILKVADELSGESVTKSAAESDGEPVANLSDDELDYATKIVDAAEKFAADSQYVVPGSTVKTAGSDYSGQSPVMEKLAKLQAKSAQQSALAKRFTRSIDDLIGKK